MTVGVHFDRDRQINSQIISIRSHKKNYTIQQGSKPKWTHFYGQHISD